MEISELCNFLRYVWINNPEMSAVKFPFLQMNKTVRTTHFFSLFILFKPLALWDYSWQTLKIEIPWHSMMLSLLTIYGLSSKVMHSCDWWMSLCSNNIWQRNELFKCVIRVWMVFTSIASQTDYLTPLLKCHHVVLTLLRFLVQELM